MILCTQDVERSQRFYQRGYWRDETMYGLLRKQSEETPDAFFVRDTHFRLTYREATARVDGIAARLHEVGVRQGDRVAIWLPSRVESALILLACSRMGYVCNTSLHRDFTTEDIVALLKKLGTVALFMQPGYGANAREQDIDSFLSEMPKLKTIYRLAPMGDGSLENRTEAAVQQGKARADLPMHRSPDRVIYIAFTSGTTGLPKGVMHSDNTLLSNGRAIARDWHLDNRSILFTLSPMSHNMGTVALATTLACGGELVVHAPSDANDTLVRILATGATYLVGVPTHAIDLLVASRQRGDRNLGKVTAFQLAGSPIPGEVVEELLALGVKPQNTYGMTENCSFQYTRPDDQTEIVIKTCGRSCDGFELKVWNQENANAEVAVGEVGELGGRGACLMLGYFDDQFGTEASFNTHGWFMTGDLGVVDREGNLQIVGRKKDLIIRGGHNIHPARIEDLTMRHKAVAKVAVIPVPDSRLGEKACVAVVLHDSSDLDPNALLSHLHDLGLSRYEMPEYFARMPSFPLTASGKILKRSLVEMLKQGLLVPTPIRWSGSSSSDLDEQR